MEGGISFEENCALNNYSDPGCETVERNDLVSHSIVTDIAIIWTIAITVTLIYMVVKWIQKRRLFKKASSADNQQGN